MRLNTPPTEAELAARAEREARARAEHERTKTMTIDERLLRWLAEEGGEETEQVIELMVDALYDVQKLRAALKACDTAFVHWQVGSVPGRPEDILALIQQVRAALAPEVSE